MQIHQNQKEVGRVEGANAPSLTKAIQHHATSFVAPVVNERIETAPEVMQNLSLPTLLTYVLVLFD